MSKLSQLLGKSKIFNIGGIELVFKPLKFEHIDLLADLDNPAKKTESLKKIISITMKEAVPDATDEEIDNLSMEYMLDISNAIVEVNGMKIKDETKTNK